MLASLLGEMCQIWETDLNDLNPKSAESAKLNGNCSSAGCNRSLKRVENHLREMYRQRETGQERHEFGEKDR